VLLIRGSVRHAEIKHGRVAMAGFVGYCVHANGIYFPWNIQAPLALFPGDLTTDLPTISFADISAAGSPADMWDALPTAAKLQILLVVGFLEMHGESSLFLEANGEKHYVRGGRPGYYPKFKGRYPHPVPLELWDPFGFTKNLSAERNEKALLAEVNNGASALARLNSQARPCTSLSHACMSMARASRRRSSAPHARHSSSRVHAMIACENKVRRRLSLSGAACYCKPRPPSVCPHRGQAGLL
jgi:hypothetical protein